MYAVRVVATLRRCSSALMAPIFPAATPSSDTGFPARAEGHPRFSITSLMTLD
jgi:hypothetical protein